MHRKREERKKDRKYVLTMASYACECHHVCTTHGPIYEITQILMSHSTNHHPIIEHQTAAETSPHSSLHVSDKKSEMPGLKKINPKQLQNK